MPVTKHARRAVPKASREDMNNRACRLSSNTSLYFEVKRVIGGYPNRSFTCNAAGHNFIVALTSSEGEGLCTLYRKGAGRSFCNTARTPCAKEMSSSHTGTKQNEQRQRCEAIWNSDQMPCSCSKRNRIFHSFKCNIFSGYEK